MPRQFGKVDSSTSWGKCTKCTHRHESHVPCPPTNVWLVRNFPAGRPGVVWLKRPMPDGQWPVDQRLPRDDSFSWWVRSACGHQAGAKQWAFCEERYADMYEWIFRADPCRYTRCPHSMIENEKRMSRG